MTAKKSAPATAAKPSAKPHKGAKAAEEDKKKPAKPAPRRTPRTKGKAGPAQGQGGRQEQGGGRR